MDAKTLRLTVDVDHPGAPFPRIHEGRYEVDPVTQDLVPLPEFVREAAHRAGVRLLRVGIGCWLPTKDPDPADVGEREWFLGSTLDDTRDPAMYRWTHLDHNLSACRELSVELLLSVDYMPASLARAGTQPDLLEIMQLAAPDYTFPDGIRNAPPADPEVFAAACVQLIRHVEESGVPIRLIELWNEPDLTLFYAGTYEEYLDMYRAFARAIAPLGYPVGGPSWAGVLDAETWLGRFTADVAREGVPLDFYSFHRYPRSLRGIQERCREVRAALDAAGLDATTLVLDEWGWALDDPARYGTVADAAFVTGALVRMADLGVTEQTHVLLIDPAGSDEIAGLVRRDGVPNPVWHTLVAFEEFQATPHRLAVDGVPDGSTDLTVLAGSAGDNLTVLLANTGEAPLRIRLECGPLRHPQVQELTEQSFALGGWQDVATGGDDDALEFTLGHGTVARVRGTRREART